MKICLDARTATPHFPGIGRYVRNLAGALSGMGASGARLALLQDRRHPFDQDGAIEIFNTAISPFSLGQQISLPGLIRRTRADLYHSPYYLMPYRAGMPTILTVYDLIPLRFPDLVSDRARLLFRLTSALAIRSCQRVIAISEATRQDFIRFFHCPPAKITAIPLAAKASFCPQSAAEIERVRQKYHLDGPFGLYIGINKPHKNLVKLIEAWAGLGAKSSLLVIAGAWDPKYPQARQVAAGLDEQVRFLGQVDEVDLPGLYSAATIFVFPSLYEGFGLPVLEALACGTPTACAQTSSLPEVAGQAAMYFDPQDTTSIREAITELFANIQLRRDLQERGIEQAARFSWERTARETLEIYRQYVA